MKRTARILSLWIAVLLSLTGYALAQAPLPISPGDNDGAGIVISGCPTFSWSEVERAISYHVTVFEPDEMKEPLAYEEVTLLKTPVLEQTIPDRGLSWTPSANKCLRGGTYVWYVAAVNIDGVSDWSESRLFTVDALAGFTAVTGENPEESTASDSGNQSSTGDNGSGALSLEQIIHSNVALEILSTSGENNQESEENPSHIPITMGEEGISNTFYGHLAGSNIDGDRSATFIGAYAGRLNTTGKWNTFVGNHAGRWNTTGRWNTFIGEYAGYSSITSDSNTFIGAAAGENTTGDANAFLGKNAGSYNTTGFRNTFIGHASGLTNTTGYRNTFVGQLAGRNNETGHDNVFIGFGAGFNNETGSNLLYIHNSDNDPPLIYGEFDNRIVKIHGELQMVSAAGPSDVRLKRNIQSLTSSLDKVMALEGVSYQWRTDQYPDWGFGETKQIGLIAQDVESILPELVSTDSKGYKAVSYDKLTAVLVEAVKELKAEKADAKAIKELHAENEKLKAQIDELRNLIKGLNG